MIDINGQELDLTERVRWLKEQLRAAHGELVRFEGLESRAGIVSLRVRILGVLTTGDDWIIVLPFGERVEQRLGHDGVRAFNTLHSKERLWWNYRGACYVARLHGLLPKAAEPEPPAPTVA